MWTEKRKNGVLYVERYKNPLTNKYFRCSVLMDKESRKNERIATELLAKKRDETINSTSVTIGKDLTLGELVELYRSHQKRTVQPSTYTRNYYACKSLMNILGSDTLVSKLTAGYVWEQFNKQDESNGTVNERITRFKALIRFGYTNDYIEDVTWLNKLKKLPDDEKRSKIQDKFYERDELNQLLEGMKCEHWRLLTEFVALTGMRIGEAIALKKENVDLKNKVIHVIENYDYIDKVTVSTKNSYSDRDVSIQDQLEVLIHKINAFYLRQSVSCGYKTRYFFSDMNGNMINYFNFNSYLKDNSLRILNKDATTHILRHTHVSLLAENGIPFGVIARRIGHSESSRATKEVYFHVTQRLKERDAEMLSKLNII